MARSTPNIAASSAVGYIHSETKIAAEEERIWQTLIDTSTYPSWNTFVPRVTIREQPSSSEETSTTLSPILQHGTKFTFHVRMDPASTKEYDTHLVVTHFRPPSSEGCGQIAWATDGSASALLPPALLTAERMHEVEHFDSNHGTESEVRNWELQTGVFAYVVRWMYGQRLQEAFDGWVRELKRFLE